MTAPSTELVDLPLFMDRAVESLGAFPEDYGVDPSHIVLSVESCINNIPTTDLTELGTRFLSLQPSSAAGLTTWSTQFSCEERLNVGSVAVPAKCSTHVSKGEIDLTLFKEGQGVPLKLDGLLIRTETAVGKSGLTIGAQHLVGVFGHAVNWHSDQLTRVCDQSKLKFWSKAPIAGLADGHDQ
ncbi:MAG: hypothetical protein KDD82_16475 [Planctomycetes bacterium]|nr:hypothetical protein [Planctomycetota bacterium]